jgi:type IV secretory pathway VirB9-like protein
MRRIVRSIAPNVFEPVLSVRPAKSGMSFVSFVLFVVSLLTLSIPAAAQTTREVAYDAHAVVRVNAKVRFTTLIILPETEEILDFVCGDKDFWIVSGTQNLAYVKPAKAGASTNLNLVTASGRIYSFWLTEGAADADLKLYVTAGGASALPDTAGVRRQTFYSAADMDELRKAVDAAHKDAETARDLAAKSAEDAETARQSAVKAADARIDQFRAAYPTQLAFPYLFKANVKPFFVAAIYHDDKFTYIRANPTELPTLYELKDGTPNLVNFQVQNGVYIVPKVLDRGELVAGKQKLVFGTTWK